MTEEGYSLYSPKLNESTNFRKTEVAKVKKTMGVQQVVLSPDKEVEAVLNYLCQQSGKLQNSGVYLARQTFFKTGKLLTGKLDLSFEPSISKSMVAKWLPSTPMQQTLMSVTAAFF